MIGAGSGREAQHDEAVRVRAMGRVRVMGRVRAFAGCHSMTI